MQPVIRETESVWNPKFIQNTPIILKVFRWAPGDFDSGMAKPVDSFISFVMDKTAAHLCAEIPGVTFAFLDETDIALLLTDFPSIDYGMGSQDLCSTAAAIATKWFNIEFAKPTPPIELETVSRDIIKEKQGKALFHAVAFNIPESDVEEYFVWRQKEAMEYAVRATYRECFKGTKGAIEGDVSAFLRMKYPFLFSLFSQDVMETQKALCEEEVKKLPDGFKQGRFFGRPCNGDVATQPLVAPIFAENPGFVLNNTTKFGGEGQL